MRFQEKIVLREFTSWKVGGEAEFFVMPKSIEELHTAYVLALQKKLSVTVLGSGTNVLISDQGIQGLTICMRHLSGLEVRSQKDRLTIEILAGTSKAEVMRVFTKHKLPPALFLAGLPGDMGGGLVMNAGVGDNLKPREFCEIVDWVEVLRPQEDFKVDRLTSAKLSWSYRKTNNWQPGIVVRMQVSWPNEPMPDLLDQLKAANKSRMQRQPLEWPSCGSVFKNPLPEKAGQLIESSGLKGHQIGGAEVSTKHANFIINKGGTTANDILALIEFVKKTVKDKTGITLQTEVVKLGF